MLKISLPHACDRFDGRIDQHYHLICVHCGVVLDLAPNALSELQQYLLSETGFEVFPEDLIVWDVCKECRDSSVSSIQTADS